MDPQNRGGFLPAVCMAAELLCALSTLVMLWLTAGAVPRACSASPASPSPEVLPGRTGLEFVSSFVHICFPGALELFLEADTVLTPRIIGVSLRTITGACLLPPECQGFSPSHCFS